MPIPAPHETMPYFQRRFTQLADFVYSPDAHEMLSRRDIHPLRAMVIRSILATPGLPEMLHMRAHGNKYRKAGYDILGIGYHAITVKDGDTTVRKFYRQTSALNEKEQQAYIDHWNAKQELILSHLAGYAVAQNFEIVEDPTVSGSTIVAATQQRIYPSATINIFRPDTIPSSAATFMSDSRAMLHGSEQSAVPDLVGRDNVLIEAHTGALKLVDPIALVADDESDEDAYAITSEFLDSFVTSSK